MTISIARVAVLLNTSLVPDPASLAGGNSGFRTASSFRSQRISLHRGPTPKGRTKRAIDVAVGLAELNLGVCRMMRVASLRVSAVEDSL